MKEKFYKVIEEVLDDNIVELRNDILLREGLGIDSLRLVMLITAIEEEFGFEFDESDLNPDNINTIGDLFLLISRKCI